MKARYIISGIVLAVISYIVTLLVIFPNSTQARLIQGVVAHNHSSALAGGSTLNPASIALSGNLSSTKACASGYTRISPNVCFRLLTSPFDTFLVRDSCTSVTLPSASATMLFLAASATAASGNVGATVRTTQMQAWNNSACNNTNIALFETVALENVAVAPAGTTLSAIQGTWLVPVPAGAVWIRFIDDAGNGGSASFGIAGYSD